MAEQNGTPMVLEGGCLCGSVRYRAVGQPHDMTHCHCATCRRASGAAFVTWFSVKTRELMWIRGEPKRYRSSDIAHRSFCADCGTPLTYQRVGSEDEIDVTACSLDTPTSITPTDHIWTISRLPWGECDDGLPSFAERRPGS
ncbi:MAG: GFA family protein [Betaproteobacteria bacterium]